MTGAALPERWWYRQARVELRDVRRTLEHVTWCEAHASEWVAATWYSALVHFAWALHWRAVARAARAGVPIQLWPKLPAHLDSPSPTRGERVQTVGGPPRRVRAAGLRARRKADRVARG